MKQKKLKKNLQTKKNKSKKNQWKILLIVFSFLLLLFDLGFAADESTKAYVSVSAEASEALYIDEINILDSNNVIENADPEYESTTMIANVEFLDDPTSYITYEVLVTNKMQTELKFTNISLSVSGPSIDAIDYEVSGDLINDNILYYDDNRIINVKFKFKSNAVPGNYIITAQLNFGDANSSPITINRQVNGSITPGDTVTLANTEGFVVLDSNSSQTTLLANYCLAQNGLQTSQSNYLETEFSDDIYWSGTDNFNNAYNNSTIKGVIDNYKIILETATGLSISSARMIIPDLDDYLSYANNGQYYWVGEFAYAEDMFVIIDDEGYDGSDYYDAPYGVRPVIVLATSLIPN